MFKSWKVVI